jgi:DnaJ-class molecular chaperone
MNKYFTNCKACCGSGSVEIDPKEHLEPIPDGATVECGECEGRGYFLTEEGEELVAFLSKARII